MNNEFSVRIKKLRLDSGLTQEKLAKELNISRAVISEWEKGRKQPKCLTLVSIAKYFKVKTDYLLGLKD